MKVKAVRKAIQTATLGATLGAMGLLGRVSLVLANGDKNGGGTGPSWAPAASSRTTHTDINALIGSGLTIASLGAAAVAVGYLIYSGVKYIMSSGDAAKAEEAQKGIVAAVIGLIVVAVAYLLVTFLLNQLLNMSGDPGKIEGSAFPYGVESFFV